MASDRKIPKDFKRYIKEIGCLLPHKVRKKLLPDLRREILIFSEENPGSSYDSFVDRFGFPKDIADAFLSQEGDSINKVHKCLKITLIILLIIAVVLIFGVHAMVKQNNEHVPIREGGDVSDSMTVIL